MARISLMSAIDALPTTEREAFTLSVWEGLASRDLGIALGISENAAKVRLSRAKSLLLAQLNTDEADS